ncbi:MAG: beta-ketoacyl-ACP synthase III [Bdellovibrionales bacterium]
MADRYRTRVAGTGSYLPEKVLTNYDLEKMVETNHDWIVERTGIHRRHIAAPHEATSDLAYHASVQALQDAGLTAQDIDAIFFCTVSPDQPMPATACFLQARLGCKNIMAVDLNAACTGFLYGLTVADQFIRTGFYKNVLVIGAETLTRYLNYKDRETCILFGDAAGAWVLTRTHEEDPNVIKTSHLHAEGALADLLELQVGSARRPFTEELLTSPDRWMKMKGREIFKNAVRTMAMTCKEALTANQMSLQDVDWLIPHQANLRIIEAVADQFEFPKEKVILAVHETGNTSAASIPTAFQIAKEEGKIKRGQNILLTAFGAGLTSGSLVLRY